MGSKTPLQQVNAEHGGKEKLVDKLVDKLDRGDEDKASFKQRLQTASNAKLLRLHRVGSELKTQFKDKDKLVAEILGLMNRGKDKDYAARLGQYSPVRLLAMHREWQKKSSKSSSAGRRRAAS